MLGELRNDLQQIDAIDPSAPRADAPLLVAELEQRHGVRLPDDFRSYLLEASGTGGWDDDVGIHWYPIERIKSLSEIQTSEETGSNSEVCAEADRYLVFADWLDWCGYGYAICCSEGPRRGYVAIVYPPAGRFICSSFTTFAHHAAADSDRLHSTAGDHYTDIP